MKITELVTELQVLWAEHGDVEVVLGEACQGDPVEPYYNAKHDVVVL